MEVQKDRALLTNLEGWTQMSSDDLTPHRLFQKADHTIEMIEVFLKDLDSGELADDQFNTVFEWSVGLRDYTILLRDSLLSVVKYDQFTQDERSVVAGFKSELLDLLKQASTNLVDTYQTQSSNKESNKYEHQNSPIPEILEQIDALNIQLKKIYRSHDKINEVRINLDAFKRDFHVQFQKQTSGVEDAVEIIDEISSKIDTIYPSGDKESIVELINTLNDSYLKLETLQNMESMELLSYNEKNSLNIPVSLVSGDLVFKSIEVQSEVAKWFSSNIFPHVIELENKRNLSVERSLTALDKVRSKLSALILDNKEEYDVAGTDVKAVFGKLITQSISPLREEYKENLNKIENHITDELFASSIYKKEDLFLPNSGSVQINNISRDAQKRIASTFKKSKSSSFNWLRKSLSRYIELERTPFNSFISNKLLVHKEDDRLSLFLKKGYLGKSFNVNRSDLVDPIVTDFKHWKNGYAASVLLYGKTGTGKTAIIGMLSQASLEEDIIVVNAGEPYFTKNRSFDGSYSIKEVIDNVGYQYVGKKIILAIDDLGLWHSKKKSLYENICDLLKLIKQYRGDIFFMINCSFYLKKRLEGFKDMDLFFSSQIEVNQMSNAMIKEALLMRFRALPELGLSDTEHANTLGAIVRNARGNIGHAMLEYCRFYDPNYDPNLKSQDFIDVIREHETILRYILCYQNLKVTYTAQFLNEIDYRDFVYSIDYLVGNKILVYIKSNVITINPLLIYSIENALN